ncbi:MAG: NUDIX hydrolase [Acidimicrobiia bacterium]
MSDVPVRPASTVLVIRPSSGSGIEVLMVQRPSRGFFGGLMVFPGGALESCDFIPNPAFADSEHRMAGIRETAEEVGFLVTSTGLVPSPRIKGGQLVDWWNSSGIDPGFERMTLVSRWVTPEGAPTRFDTRFYLVAIDDDPEIILDSEELVGHAWVTPLRGIDEVRQGTWQMILPTMSHLRWLSRHTTVESAVAAAGGADGQTVIEPVASDGELRVRYRSPL